MHPIARIRIPLSTVIPVSNKPVASIFSCLRDCQQPHFRNRPFSTSPRTRKEDYAKAAKALNQKGLDDHENGFNKQLDGQMGEAEEKQVRSPWNREGSDKPPVKRLRSASAMTKGESFYWIQFWTKYCFYGEVLTIPQANFSQLLRDSSSSYSR